jgi:DNA-binding response OmpR family regulator
VKQKILVVDDDKKLAALLSGYFSTYNFETYSVSNGNDAVPEYERLSPDIIILDIMLPGKDGFKVLQEIRERSNVPVIMLTARGDLSDKVVGLEIGADDYLPKPFEPRELVARIQSVLRRTSDKHEKEIDEFGSLKIDYTRHEVFINDVSVELTTMEYYLLTFFSRNPGTVFDRDAIFEKLKGYDDDSFDRSIDVLISRLRQKLGDDPKKPDYIKTIWGSGYKFIGRKK